MKSILNLNLNLNLALSLNAAAHRNSVPNTRTQCLSTQNTIHPCALSSCRTTLAHLSKSPTQNCRVFRQPSQLSLAADTHAEQAKTPNPADPNCPLVHGFLSASTSNSLPQPVHWIIRDDFTRLMEHTRDELDSRHSSSCQKPRSIYFADGQPLQFDSEQSLSLLTEIFQFYHEQFNYSKDDTSKFDHALLLIKPGTSEKTLLTTLQAFSGEWGVQIFKDAQFKQRLPLPNDQGLIIFVRGWQQNYIHAVLKELDIVSTVSATIEASSLSSLHCFKESFTAVQQTIRQRQEPTICKKHSWLTPSLNRSIYNQVCSTIAFSRYHRKIPGPLPGASKQPAMGPLLEILRNKEMTPTIHAVADAIEAGYINIHLLNDHAFRQLSFDLPGSDRTHINGGFALASQMYIHHSDFQSDTRSDTQSDTHLDKQAAHKTQEKQIDSNHIQLVGYILHEAIHALDWLEHPQIFKNHKTDIHEMIGIETRAYQAQRHLLHLYNAPFCFDSPDPEKISNDDFLKAVIIDLYWRHDA